MADESKRTDDELIAGTEKAEKVSAAAKLFDVRLVIGGLFTLYGVIVTLLGLFDSKSEIDKAQGVRINLWMGLAMLAVGLLMLLWLRLNPLKPPVVEPQDGERATSGE
jgi:hypothetical protein